MSAYAEPEQLEQVCQLYSLPLPDDEATDWLLEQATLDVDRYLGSGYELADLEAEQAAALQQATALQAAFRIAQGDLQLGADDNIATAGPLTFSLRSVPRFSAEAAERLAGYGLFQRSGTVSTPSDDDG